MATPPPASEMLDREFLEVRARMLEMAAALDRIDRAEGSVDDDPRIRQIRQAIEVLDIAERDRAEQIQLIFSLQYDDQLQERLVSGE